MYSDLEKRYFTQCICDIKGIFKKNLFNEKLIGKEDRYWANDIMKKGKRPSLEVEHHYTENGNTWKGIG